MSEVESEPVAVVWAMQGQFSYAALRSYLAAGGQVRAVFVPLRAMPGEAPVPSYRPVPPLTQRVSRLPMLTSAVEPSALTLASEHGIAAYEVGDPRDPAFTELLARLHAHVACVACWPRRISGSVLAAFPLAMLNLHPSLLPEHRGPAPLFWTLRQGDACTGVTVHLLDASFDTGPIVAQQPVELEDGLTGFALEERCATAGGALLARAALELAASEAHPRPQEPGAGSYEPWPQPSDFVITPERSARWAYNFACAAGYWGGPVVIACEGARFAVHQVLDYRLDQTLASPWERHGVEVRIRCRPGVLRVIPLARH